jgi:hypothetical protein
MAESTITKLQNLRDPDVGTPVVAGPGGTVQVKLSDVTIDQALDMNAKAITNVGAPVADTDAATKAYADANTSFANVLAVPYADAPGADIAQLVSDVGAVDSKLDGKSAVHDAMTATIGALEDELDAANTAYGTLLADLAAANAQVEAPGDVLASISSADALITAFENQRDAVDTAVSELQQAVTAKEEGSIAAVLRGKMEELVLRDRPVYAESSVYSGSGYCTLEYVRSRLQHFDVLASACDLLVAESTIAAVSSEALRATLGVLRAMESVATFHTPAGEYAELVGYGARPTMLINQHELVPFEVACQEVLLRFATLQKAVAAHSPSLAPLAYSGAAVMTYTVDPAEGLIVRPGTPSSMFNAAFDSATMSGWVSDLKAVDSGLSSGLSSISF